VFVVFIDGLNSPHSRPLRASWGELAAAAQQLPASRNSVSADILSWHQNPVALVEIANSVDLRALQVLVPGRIDRAEAGFQAPSLAWGRGAVAGLS
jgi:hypothetical protein